MSNDDWDAVEAAAKRVGWKHSGPLLQGPCPVTDEEYCTVEPASANDGVLMRCYAPSCKKIGPKLGGIRYHQHKDALLNGHRYGRIGSRDGAGPDPAPGGSSSSA